MDFSNDNYQFQYAMEFIDSCCDFSHKDGRITTPFFSKISFVLFFLLTILGIWALNFFNAKYRYFDYSDNAILILPIMLGVGLLIGICIKTNKVIDYKSKTIYCELLIFNILICRYNYINGNDIAAVGNNVGVYHVKRGIRYIYYTSLLLKDGTLNDFFEFGDHYSAAYSLAVVLANYYRKPLTITKKNQQLSISSGLRLSTITLNIYEIENQYQIRTAIFVLVVNIALIFLFFILK